MIEHLESMRRVAANQVKPQDVDDMVSEAFVTVLNRKGSKIRNMGAYLRRTVLYACYASYGKKKELLLGDFDLLVATEDPDIAEEIEMRTNKAKMYKAINKLYKHQKNAIEMRLEGLTYKEIASILTIPIGTARRSVHDGIKKLRKLCT